MSAPTDIPAGWYADQTMVDTQRYWDGSQWTDQIRPMVDPVGSAGSVDSFGAAGPVASMSHQPPGQPTPGVIPATGDGPVLIRKESSASGLAGLGIVALLVMVGVFMLAIVLPILALALFAATSDPFESESISVAEPAVVPVAPLGDQVFPFDQPSEVVFEKPDGLQPTVWLVTVGEPRDVTASTLDDNPSVTIPDGLRYMAFDIDVALIEADPDNPTGLNVLVVGGFTGAEYVGADFDGDCGSTPQEFTDQQALRPTDDLSVAICLPVRAEDVDHPGTQVVLSSPQGEVRFIN